MRTPLFALFSATLAIAALGCSPSSNTRHASTAEVGTSIREVRTEVASAKVQVEEVQNNLQGLMATKDDATLPRRYQLFAQSVDDLEAQREALSDRADDMLKRRDAYLDEWRRGTESISDPELRRLANERRAMMADQFNVIREQLVEAGAAMDPVIHRLNNIETTLKYDLTRQSIDRVAKTVEDRPLGEAELDEALSRIQEQLDELDKISKLD